MATRRFHRGSTVKVLKGAGVSYRYLGRKGVVTELRGKADGTFLYGLTIHDRVSTLVVYEDEVVKA
jgi:hypothetical protein